MELPCVDERRTLSYKNVFGMSVKDLCLWPLNSIILGRCLDESSKYVRTRSSRNWLYAYMVLDRMLHLLRAERAHLGQVHSMRVYEKTTRLVTRNGMSLKHEDMHSNAVVPSFRFSGWIVRF